MGGGSTPAACAGSTMYVGGLLCSPTSNSNILASLFSFFFSFPAIFFRILNIPQIPPKTSKFFLIFPHQAYIHINQNTLTYTTQTKYILLHINFSCSISFNPPKYSFLSKIPHLQRGQKDLMSHCSVMVQCINKCNMRKHVMQNAMQQWVVFHALITSIS